MRALSIPLLVALATVPLLPAPSGAEEAPLDLNRLLLQVREVAGTLAQHGYSEVPGDALDVLNALVRSVDPGLEVLTPEAAEARLHAWRGRAWATGLQMGLDEGRAVVRAVEPDSPAAAAGLEEGQTLARAGGTALTDLTLPEIEAALATPGPGALRLDLGPPLDGGEPIEIATELRPRPMLGGPAEQLSSGIFYLRVAHVAPGAAAAVRQALEAAGPPGPSGLVVDLRSTGGEALDEVPALARYLALTPGRPVDRTGPDGEEETEGADASGHPVLGIPVMILVDSQTAGAAEVLAAVARDEGRRALLVGQSTAGDFGLRRPVTVLEDRTLLLAAGQIQTRGQRYDGRRGLTPAIVVAQMRRPYREPEAPPDLPGRRRPVLDEEQADLAMRRRIRGDVALERAVEVLLGLQALERRPAR